MNPQSFSDFVFDGEPPAATFRPIATYDPDGDCIEFFMSNANFYGKRLDSLVTVYLDQEGDELVGALIKGVSKILREAQRKASGFKHEIVGRKIDLAGVVTACFWGIEREPGGLDVVFYYKKLRQFAAANNVEVDADQALT